MRRLVIIAVISMAATLASSVHAAVPTGRLLVITRAAGHGIGAHSAATSVRAVAARSGARLAGQQVPQIGLITVRPAGLTGLHALAQRLRRDPSVVSVQVEHRATTRFTPADPAFVQQLPGSGVPAGTTYEWWAVRENFPPGWDITQGRGALVAIIDTGVDAAHPEFSGRIAADVNQSADFPASAVGVDPAGHGTHVASLACAADNNGVGLAGAGLGCKLIVEKSDLSDSSVAASIIDATNKGAGSINMSFGTDGTQAAAKAIVDAINYAYSRNVVMVAAAADTPVIEQGDPSNVLQPTSSGPNVTQGLGLDVTAANFADQRASFAGLGSQISIAAYGAYGATGGPPGLLGAFPSQITSLETGTPGPQGSPPCGCRTTFNGDPRFAYLQGTSMAAPQVAAAAALVRFLNPGLTASDVITLMKQTATRPAGVGWTQDLGWGILNAGAALTQAKTIDRTPPVSKLTGPQHPRSTRVMLRWTGSDVPPPGVFSSGIARFEVYHSVNGGIAHRFLTTTRHSATVTVHPGQRYAFYTLAIDHSGNHELAPAHPDARVRLTVSRTRARSHRR